MKTLTLQAECTLCGYNKTADWRYNRTDPKGIEEATRWAKDYLTLDHKTKRGCNRSLNFY